MSTSSLTSSYVSEGSNSFGTTNQQEKISFTKCPRCRFLYDFLKRSNHPTSKVPLILNCRHTVCEDCIYKLNLSGNATCPVCETPFTVPRNQWDRLCEIFIPHYSLIGYLMWTKNSAGKKRVGPLSADFVLKQDSIVDVKPEGSENGDCVDDFLAPQLSFKFEFCAEHTTSTKNLYCTDCDASFCCYCFIDNHGGHKPIHLYKLDQLQLAELPQLRQNAKKLMKQLYATKKKLFTLKTFKVGNVEIDIINFFGNLHGRLHFIEDHLRKKLSTLQVQNLDLNEIANEVKANLGKIAHLLPLLDNLDTKEIHLRKVFAELQTMLDVPCVVTANDESTLQPVVLIGGDEFEKFCDNLDVQQISPREYKLVPCESWDSISLDNFSLDLEVPDRNFSSLSSVASRLPGTSQESAEEPCPRVKMPTDENYREKEVQRVIVTHINDLDSFYVQEIAAQNAFREFNNKLAKYRFKDLICEDILLGRLYAVLYVTKKSKTWRRGKLVDIVNTDPQNPLFNILYIDYGNSQQVSQNKMKKLDQCFIKKVKNFAIECKLVNPHGSTWSDNAHLHFAQIVAEKEINLKTVKKLMRAVQEVELLVPNSQGGFLKITDLLMQWSSPETSVAGEESNETPIFNDVKLLENSKMFKIQQMEEVTVSYVKDPDHIYVQLVQHLDLFKRMKINLEEFYSRKYSTCIPLEGSDVIVKYDDPVQGLWHRARILSVFPTNKTAKVFFVDWGKSAEVPWSNFKQLSEEFTRSEHQAIAVKLAHVERFLKNNYWPEEVKTFLTQELCNERLCKMVVSSVDPLEVALFKYTPDAELCVNALLVEKHMAVSIGGLTKTLYWIHEENEKITDNNLSSQLIKKTEEVIINADMEVRGLKTQVHVVNCVSPDLIYVKFVSTLEKEEKMYKELVLCYNDKRVGKPKWELNDYCVVPEASKVYARGLVKEKKEGDNYVVYLYDLVREITVRKEMMFVYDKYFQKSYLNFVYKCHLANIKPAGDSGKWANITIEVLQQIFNTYKSIYVQRIYDDLKHDRKSLSVNMWYALTTPGSALEPARLNFISINKSLVESGVALNASFVVPSFTTVKPESPSKLKLDSSFSDSEETSRTAEKEVEKSDTTDWYDLMLTEAQEEITKSALQNWPAITPLKTREFEGVLTCIDNEGVFSIRDLEMDSLYKELEQYINSHFSSNRLSIDGTDWSPGQMCTISYQGSWYRGTVLEVRSHNELIVEQIDFGSDHSVEKKDVNKLIMYPDLPPFINKIQLYDVNPENGTWHPDDFETLLTIATDNVKVVIKGDLEVPVPFAEIYLDNGQSINDRIVKLCPRLTRSKQSKPEEPEIKVETKDDNEEETKSLSDETVEVVATFKYAPLPQILEKTEMFVVSVLKFDTVVVNVARSTSQSSESLTMLSDKIQKRAASQPILTEIKLNQPCICQRSRDGLWCRAQIFNIENLEYGHVYAFLVDYGLLDMVMIQDLKMANCEWLSYPVFNYVATLNIQVEKESQTDYVMTYMNRFCGKLKLVEIVNRDPLTIQLYENEHQLCYQNFLKCGILKIPT